MWSPPKSVSGSPTCFPFRNSPRRCSRGQRCCPSACLFSLCNVLP
ncbi:MAG: hypothetical protein IJ607_10495 [Bacteroidaceae bacterium]|nr:hypothetical protein [Bacteroidaceae bacterium]